MNACIRVIAFVIGLLSLPAAATHHLWKMSEVYSNADGSVQYLMMEVDANGEHLMATHSLFSRYTGSSQRFVFPNHLPSDATRGRVMLIATEGFAALNVVTPDYVVPNGFFSAGGGVLDFASLDFWLYPPLPAAGGMAMRRDGTLVPNAPTNFAGEVGRLAGSAPMNFQALWWRSPGGSENGWGVNITHQGEILFATWFTYDTDGSGMWLVVSDARKVANNAYTGTLFRTTGPAFDTVPFDSTRVAAVAVGSATFTFSDENNGTFAYTVNGVSQTKAITRQVYSSPVARCASGGAAGAATSYQDLWWRSPGGSETGWGVNLTHQGDILFATWFTYAANGRGQWLVISDARRTAPGVYTGTLFRTRGPAFNAPWNNGSVQATAVGTGTFTFSGPNNGTFAYTVDGVAQTKTITRQAYETPATVCVNEP